MRRSGVYCQTVAKLERVYCMYDCVGVEKGSVLCLRLRAQAGGRWGRVSCPTLTVLGTD